jgi:PAS domain-containing protein
MRVPDSASETDLALGSITDETREVAVPASRENGYESKFRQIIDSIPTLAWCNLADGANEFLNRRWYDYTGLSPQAAHGGGWMVAIHPEDLPRLTAKWGTVRNPVPGDYEVRLLLGQTRRRCIQLQTADGES